MHESQKVRITSVCLKQAYKDKTIEIESKLKTKLKKRQISNFILPICQQSELS